MLIAIVILISLLAVPAVVLATDATHWLGQRRRDRIRRRSRLGLPGDRVVRR